MYRVLFIASILALTTATTLNITENTICKCNQIQTQKDCAMNPTCTWGTACSAIVCDTQTTAPNCLAATQCAWNGTKCENFSSCSKYVSTATLSCAQQSGLCEAATGTACQVIKPKACTTYTVQGDCLANMECRWTGTACANWSACGDETTQAVCGTQTACQWDATNNKCIAANCTKFTNAGSCQSYATTINGSSYALCTWNTTDNKCTDGNTTTLTADTCYLQTFTTYEWTGTECKQCNMGVWLSAVLGLLLLLA